MFNCFTLPAKLKEEKERLNVEKEYATGARVKLRNSGFFAVVPCRWWTDL